MKASDFLKREVLKAIKNNKNEDGWCYLTGEEIGRKIGWCASSVNTAIRELEGENLILNQIFKRSKAYKVSRKLKVKGEA